MIPYETIYITHPEASEAVLTDLNNKITDIIKKHNGAIDKIEDWGIRKLGYKIQHHTRGHYVYITYQGAAGVVKELDKILQVREDVIKQLTVRREIGA